MGPGSRFELARALAGPVQPPELALNSLSSFTAETEMSCIDNLPLLLEHRRELGSDDEHQSCEQVPRRIRPLLRLPLSQRRQSTCTHLRYGWHDVLKRGRLLRHVPQPLHLGLPLPELLQAVSRVEELGRVVHTMARLSGRSELLGLVADWPGVEVYDKLVERDLYERGKEPESDDAEASAADRVSNTVMRAKVEQYDSDLPIDFAVCVVAIAALRPENLDVVDDVLPHFPPSSLDRDVSRGREEDMRWEDVVESRIGESLSAKEEIIEEESASKFDEERRARGWTDRNAI